MKINRNEFVKILNSVKPGLATKEIIEQSTSFVFINDQVITYNNEIAVHHPICGLDFEGSIPSKELLAIVNKLTGEEIDLSATENELIVKSGKSKSGIRLESNISLNISDLAIPEKWESLNDDFIKGIDATLPTTSKSLVYPILTSIHLTADFAESTDNFRLAKFDWVKSYKAFKNDVLLPRECGNYLPSFGAKYVAQGEGWIHFKNADNAVLSCRTVSGEYPNLEDHLGIDSIGNLEFRDGVDAMLDKAGVFVNDKNDSLVNITVSDKGLLTIRGEGEFGWYEESCRVNWDSNEEVKFSIDPANLMTILKQINTAEIGKSKIKFSTDNFQYVAALEVQ